MRSMRSLQISARSDAAPKLRLVTELEETKVERPPRNPGGVVRIPVAAPIAAIGDRSELRRVRVAQRAPLPGVLLFEAEHRGMKVVRRMMRAGVLVGMLATAWQVGLVLGAL